jgi:hypothetical protein
VATPERPAGVKNGWRFHVTVYFGIVGGALLIVASVLLRSAHVISGEVRDAGLVIGGLLVGLIAVALNEIYRLKPERARLERERELERQRHQEERRLDFEQYRAIQSELRDMRSNAAALQSKLELTGALDRDRVGDALLLGFYFHRRGERLPSPPHQSIFTTAARRLKLVTEKRGEIRLDKPALHEVLEITYGPIVAEAFDLGYLLSHLHQDGSADQRPEILSELERQLNELKLDSKPNSAAAFPEEASELFKKLAARVVSIVRRPS